MKHILCIIFLLQCMVAMGQGNHLLTVSEMCDSVEVRYGLDMIVPSKYRHRVYQYGEQPGWTNINPKKGHYGPGIAMMIVSSDETCAVLIQSYTAYSEKQLEMWKHAGDKFLKRELYYMSAGEDLGLVIETKVISETESLIWSDIPIGLSVFSDSSPSFPGVDDVNNPTELQRFYLKQCPFLRRCYYLSDGYPAYGFIILTRQPFNNCVQQVEHMLADIFTNVSISF